MNRIRAMAGTVMRFCFRTAMGISLILIAGALLLILNATVDTTKDAINKEDIAFTLKIVRAFDEKKERVAVRDIFPGDWDYVCTNWDYEGADAPIRMGLQLSKEAHLQILPENIYYNENQRGLMFVKRKSDNNYKVNAYRYIRSYAGGSRLEGGDSLCRDKSSAYLTIHFIRDNFSEPYFVLTSGGKYD